MKLLEYMGRELLVKNSIPIPAGFTIDKLDDLKNIQGINYPVVVKAQVQVGGRGKAGGVKIASNFSELKTICREMLYSTLKGLKVNRLLIVEKIEPINEYYLSIVLDRFHKVPMIIFSSEGGIDIEETARNNSDKVVKIPINPFSDIPKYIVD